MVVTQSEAAKVFGVSTRTIQRWETDGFPRQDAEVAAYDLTECVAWALQRERDRLSNVAGDSFEQARARKTAIEADLKELELAQLRGELVPIDEVAELVEAPLAAVDESLVTAKRRHAKTWARKLKVTQGVARALIDELVEEVRADLKLAVEDSGDLAA